MSASVLHAAALLFLAASAGEHPPVPEGGTATMPLEQLLPLLDRRAEARPEAPPLDAVVTRTELKGRLATDAVHLEARFQVRVLASGRWIRVPLLGVSPETVLDSDWSSEGAVVAIHGGELSLLANEPGDYPVNVKLAARAARSGSRRQAALRVAPGGPPAPLQLEVDPAFTVVEPAAAGEASVSIFPRAGEWTVAWTVAEQRASSRATQRPALEPKISRARAVWVSTLEGKLGLRVAYALRLNRPEKISFDLPAGHKLERASVNGRAVALPEPGRPLEVEVAPPNAGESEAHLELVLSEELGVLHLSGNVKLTLPRTSWPIADLAAEAYLPAVFNYRRQGGSLEQIPDDEKSWDATFGTLATRGDPLPGKVVRFRQYLISGSAPDVDLGYSVDIAGSYFR